MTSVEQVEIPASHRDLLHKKALAHVATIGPRGEPHSSPIWYGWDGEHIVWSHTTRRQKYRNLKRDPRHTLSIVDPDDPYRYLEVRGTAEIEPDPEKTLIHALSKKYRGVDRYTADGPRDDRVIIKVIPTRVLAMGGE